MVWQRERCCCSVFIRSQEQRRPQLKTILPKRRPLLAASTRRPIMSDGGRGTAIFMGARVSLGTRVLLWPHGYYGAAGRRPHYHAHRYYRPRFDAARGYYGAAGSNSRYYARRYYPTRAAVADPYYGSTGYYSQYYSRRYYPTRPAVADSLFGSTSYYPQYYSHRYYPTRPAAVDGYYAASGYYPQYDSRRYYPTQPVGAAVASTDLFAPTNWRASCVNGRVCTGGYSYNRGGVPICRGWAACNY